MSERICPKCHQKLGSYDNYFCSNCGIELEEASNDSSTLKSKIYYASNFLEKQSKFALPKITFTKKNLRLILSVILILGMGIGLRYGLVLIDKYVLQVPDQEVATPIAYPGTVLDLDLPLESDFFGSDQVFEYVPSYVSSYIEVHDLVSFAQQYTNIAQISPELLQLLQNNVNDHFIIYSFTIGTDTHWVYMFIPKNVNELAPIANSFYDPYWKVRIVEDRLVVTSNENVFGAIEDAKKGLILNIALNSKFSRLTADLPKEGKILVTFLSSASKEHYINFDDAVFNDAFAELLQTVLSEGTDALVIN